MNPEGGWSGKDSESLGQGPQTYLYGGYVVHESWCKGSTGAWISWSGYLGMPIW